MNTPHSVRDWNSPGTITRGDKHGDVVDAYETMRDLLDALIEHADAGDSPPWYVAEHLRSGPRMVDLSREIEERRETAEMERRHKAAHRARAMA